MYRVRYRRHRRLRLDRVSEQQLWLAVGAGLVLRPGQRPGVRGPLEVLGWPREALVEHLCCPAALSSGVLARLLWTKLFEDLSGTVRVARSSCCATPSSWLLKALGKGPADAAWLIPAVTSSRRPLLLS